MWLSRINNRKEVRKMETEEVFVPDEYGEPHYGTEDGPRADGYFAIEMIGLTMN